MNHGERHRALTRFAREGARTQPPVFVGRGAVIEDIANAAELAHDKWLSGAIDARSPGLTRLVQGAPGVGKTSLLRHLQEEWQKGTPGPNNPICVNLDVDAFSSAGDLHKTINETLPQSILEEWGMPIVRTITKYLPLAHEDAEGAAELAVDVALAGTRRFYQKDRVRQFPAPVVVMIDEAQMVEPFSVAAKALRRLHLGHVGDIPVLPVFAGLGYLHSHLQRDGIDISRYSDDSRCVHTLGGLSESESEHFFGEWLLHFDVVATDAEFAQWSDTLIRDAQGWPMHINGFLGALADDLAHSPNPATLASVDIRAVRRTAARNREIYYSGRYRGVVESNIFWAGRAMAALSAEGPVLKANAIDIIRAAGSAGDEEASILFSALVERGFLQRQGTGLTFVCPIPSLSSHAAINAMQKPGAHLAATVGDVDRLRRLMADGADIEHRDALGRTPLAIAAECRWADVASALLKAGADPDAPDTQGTTPRKAWPEFDWPAKCPKDNHDSASTGMRGGPHAIDKEFPP